MLLSLFCTGSGAGGKLYWSGVVWLTGTCITCAGTGEALTAASLVPGVAPDSVFGSGLCPPNLIPNCIAFGIPGGVWMGVHFLRNLLFLSVSLLDPNVITLYCLVFGSACTTTPLLSHLLGLLPNWFCSIMWSPISRWGSSLVPCFSWSCSLAPLGARCLLGQCGGSGILWAWNLGGY